MSIFQPYPFQRILAFASTFLRFAVVASLEFTKQRKTEAGVSVGEVKPNLEQSFEMRYLGLVFEWVESR